jgi:hypothetical protein
VVPENQYNLRCEYVKGKECRRGRPTTAYLGDPDTKTHPTAAKAKGPLVLTLIVVAAVLGERFLADVVTSAGPLWYALLVTADLAVMQLCARMCRPSAALLAVMLVLLASMCAGTAMTVISGAMLLAVNGHLTGNVANQVASIYTAAYGAFGYVAVYLTTLQLLALIIKDKWAASCGLDNDSIFGCVRGLAILPRSGSMPQAIRIAEGQE